ncbi:MAG: hypothetical protein KBG15_09100 [Kofleriaceae bacterium]|nr:hypothetical protein [Kofleriaceae bacterium]
MPRAQQSLRWLAWLVFAGALDAAPCDANPGVASRGAQLPVVIEPFVISDRGVGRFAGHKYVDDVATLASLRAAIGDVADMAIEFAVKDIGVEVETEEGYFSVRLADREVLQLMRPAEPGQLLTAEVVDPVFVTATGIRVGDNVNKLASAYPGLQCVARKSDAVGLLSCRSGKSPALVFGIDATGYRGKSSNRGVALSKRSIAGRKIFVIVGKW